MTPLRRMNLRTKLILSYLVLLLLPLSLLGGFAFRGIDRLLVEQGQRAYQETIRQAALGVGNTMDTFRISATAVRNNERLASALRIMRIRPLSLGEEYDHYSEIRSVKDTVLHLQGALAVRLAVQGNATFVSDMFDIFSMDTLRADAVYDRLPQQWLWLRSDAFTAMRVSRADSFQLCMRIPDISHQASSLGYLFVEVDSQALFSSLQSLTLPEGGFLLLHDGENTLFQTGLPDAGGDLAATLDALASDDGLVPVEASVAGSGWSLVMGIPRGSLAQTGESLPSMLLWMAIVLSAVGIAFALVVTNSINRRLQMTLDGIHRIEEGELGITIPVIGGDEYSRMQMAFNHMSETIARLVGDLVDSQAQQKQAEMRLLYEQINPHFIYNTLDVIRWEALRVDAPSLANLADTLVAYLRQSLNHGQEMIEVAREIDMIDRYVDIMNFRYQGAIAYRSQVDEGIAGVRIIKMVLQPLVENAILHGIMGKAEKRGRIDVRGWREGSLLWFCVEDDGAGMSAGQIAALMMPGTLHYGLWNVQERVRAQYGPQSGVIIESEPGAGTKVTVILTMQQE